MRSDSPLICHFSSSGYQHVLESRNFILNFSSVTCYDVINRNKRAYYYD